MNELTHIIPHHSGVVSDNPQFDGINEDHKMKGFPESELGLYGGYHVLIDRDKKVKRYRNDHEIGAHAKDDGMNHKSLGVCIAGDFTVEKPEDWQVELLQEVVTEWQEKYDIPNENIILHRRIKRTWCPGINWLVYLNVRPAILERFKSNALRFLNTLKRFLARLMRR